MNASHPIHEETLELLALGVLAAEEADPLRAHLVSCADCSRRFAEARGRVALLALAAPPQNPPPTARENLLRRIRAENIAEQSAPRFAPPPPRWWNSVWVPAAAVLAVATILLWVNDRRLDNQLQQIQQAERKSQAEIDHQRALVSFFSAQDTKAVELASTHKMSNDWAHVRYNSRLGMICYTGDLPAPPPNKEYQMWIVPEDGKPVNAGVFLPSAFSGGRMCMAKMPEGIDCKSFAVTLEAMGGVPQPSGPMVLSGTGP